MDLDLNPCIVEKQDSYLFVSTYVLLHCPWLRFRLGDNAVAILPCRLSPGSDSTWGKMIHSQSMRNIAAILRKPACKLRGSKERSQHKLAAAKFECRCSLIEILGTYHAPEGIDTVIATAHLTPASACSESFKGARICMGIKQENGTSWK